MKLLSLLMALLLALTTLTAFAEDEFIGSVDAETMTVATLSGYVLDVQEELLLVKTPDGLYVEVLLTEETASEGADVLVGDFVHILYNGMMTRSLPAQITAQAVSCHKLQGIVSEMAEDGFLLTFGEESWYVGAAAEQLTGIQDGMFVTVFHNGMMTMSIPAQVNADHIRGQEIVGVVTEMMENGFILTVESEEIPYAVYPKENALIFVQPEPGMEVIVVTDGLMTSGLDQITINAMEIIPLPVVQEIFDIAGIVTEVAPEYILIQTAEGQLVQANIFEETYFEGKEIEAGDYIHITYNGMMTFSDPAPTAAMKVACNPHQREISPLHETGFILNTEMEPIIVNAPAELLEGLSDGMTVTVYTNGAMTMSLPAQVGAEMITATQTIVD